MDRDGEPRAAWENATCWAVVAVRCAALACWLVFTAESAVASVGVCSGRCHNPVGGDLVPVRTGSWFLSVMATLVAVNVAVRPASQSCPMEMRDPDPASSSLNMWASRADGGRLGMSKVASWVEVIVSPLGRLTRMGTVVTVLLVQWACDERNVAVHPVSAMAVLFLVDGEGPSESGVTGVFTTWLRV